MDLFSKEIFFKAAESADGEIVAYLTTFENEDLVGDVISTGAVDKFVESFDPVKKKLPMLYSHDTKSLIGEWVKLEVDDYGLKGTGVLYTEVSTANDVHKLLKRNALASVSIGFSSKDYEKNGETSWRFNEIELVETSIVLNPANPQAKVLSVKSDDGLIETKALKQLLQSGGLSRSETDALFMEGWRGLKNLRAEEVTENQVLDALRSFQL